MNNPDELDKFKREINLAAFMEDQGFTYDQKRSTRNNPAFRGNNDYEVFIVGKKQDTGHHVFINPFNESDCGSVIDFVQNRNKMNLGEVRKYLRDYMGIVQDRPLKDYQQYRAEKLDKELIDKMFAQATILKHRDFLYSRGLSDQTVDSYAFQNRVGNQVYRTSEGKTYINTVFPIYNQSGLAGLEKRNHNYKEAAEDSDKANGMWLSMYNKNNPAVHRNFSISESPIDAMSKFQLEGKKKDDESTLYFSSNGSVNRGQIDFVQSYIDRCKPIDVRLSNDNDNAGARFNLTYMGMLKDVNPSWEQNNTTFFMKPMTVKDSSKVNLDIEIKGLGERQQQFSKAFHDKLVKLVGEENFTIKEGRNDAGSVIRYTVPNKQTVIEDLQKIVKEMRPVEVCKIDKPLNKDYNEDLLESVKKKQSRSLKV